MPREKIALTDVLRGGVAGPTIVHYVNPGPDWSTLCRQWDNGRVAHRGTMLDVDCMTCLVHATRPSIEDRIATAMGVPKEFLFAEEDDGADDQ